MNTRKTTIASDLVVDGRTARRQRNKSAVLDALIDLTNEADTEPPVEAIADRAGVSYRSVYRYFDDRTELLLAAIGRVIGANGQIFAIEDLGHGPLDARIDRIVEVRITAYHQLAALTRVAVQRRAHEPAVGDAYERVRQTLRDQIERQFEPELSAMPARERRLVAVGIDTMLQFESLDFLARHEGLDDASMTKVLARHLRAHLDVRGA